MREASFAVLAEPTPENLDRLRAALEAEVDAELYPARPPGEAFRARMKSDEKYLDAQIAGWWVWGQSAWIGSGWCATNRLERDKGTRPDLGGDGAHGHGIHAAGPHYGRGVLSKTMRAGQLPDLGASDMAAWGRGVHAKDLRLPQKQPRCR